MRETAGLEIMPHVWYNTDFEKKKTTSFLSKYFNIKEILNFGVYDFIARVIHPLLVKPEQPKYDAHINKIAAKLSLLTRGFEDISRVLFIVLKKK
ncbi:MAG: hypothetical protein ABIA63_01215 [bacterium]